MFGINADFTVVLEDILLDSCMLRKWRLNRSTGFCLTVNMTHAADTQLLSGIVFLRHGLLRHHCSTQRCPQAAGNETFFFAFFQALGCGEGDVNLPVNLLT